MSAPGFQDIDFAGLVAGGGLKVRVGGIGGQGAVLLADVLAHAGALEGLNTACSTLYSSQARGGATKAEVILSSEPIDFPHAEEPHVILAMAQEAVDEFSDGLQAPSIYIYDEAFVRRVPDGVRAVGLGATKTVLDELGRGQPANFFMLGALVGICGCVGLAALEEAMAEHVRARFLEMNLRAVRLGMAAVGAVEEG